MKFSFSIIFLLSSIETAFSFNCSDGNYLCQICKQFREHYDISSYFDSGECSIYIGIQDSNLTIDNIPQKCEILFNKLHPTSCQLAVVANINLLGFYIQNGIRAPGKSMLLGLEREECTERWNWYSRLENRTYQAGIGKAADNCSVTAGAFVNMDVVRIDPDNFTATGVLCQCTNRVEFLPIASEDDGETSNKTSENNKITIVFIVTLATLLKMMWK